MFFFCSYSVLATLCCSFLFIGLSYPSNEERKIKKSPELQHQWILSVHSLFWQWLIISPETRACCILSFRMKEKWGGTRNKVLAMEEKKGGKGRSWLITNNYSFLIKLTSSPADSKTLSTFSIPSSLAFSLSIIFFPLALSLSLLLYVLSFLLL